MLMPRPVAYYTERSAHFLERVDDELAAGELEIACEMLWGGAAHAVKAAAVAKAGRTVRIAGSPTWLNA